MPKPENPEIALHQEAGVVGVVRSPPRRGASTSNRKRAATSRTFRLVGTLLLDRFTTRGPAARRRPRRKTRRVRPPSPAKHEVIVDVGDRKRQVGIGSRSSGNHGPDVRTYSPAWNLPIHVGVDSHGPFGRMEALDPTRVLDESALPRDGQCPCQATVTSDRNEFREKLRSGVDAHRERMVNLLGAQKAKEVEDLILKRGAAGGMADMAANQQ
jgi:hypothetical protein